MTVAAALAQRLPALRPDPDTARAWVERELRRPEYHRSLLQRLTTWLDDLLRQLQDAAGQAGGLSAVVAVALTVALLALVVALAVRVRRDPVVDRGGDPALGTGTVPPAQHRQSAERALAAGRFEECLVEAFRAVAARATERGVLEERPGRTAHELAAELAPVHPAHAADLALVSRSFDAVFYGGRPAGADDARAALDLDDALRRARPARGADPALAGSAVPR